MFNIWVVEVKLIQKYVFGRSWLNTSVFEKHFILYSCILFIKYYALRSFCIKMLYFSKKLIFPDFRSIEPIARPIKIAIKIFGLNLPNSIGIRSIETKNFQFLSIWPNFFHASFMFRIYMHCIVFCIHLAVLRLYLSLFSHITCIHFAKLDTQLDLKIDWLIFESFVHSSMCYFYVWTVENYFLKRYDG